jgi:hypothetical protein
MPQLCYNVKCIIESMDQCWRTPSSGMWHREDLVWTNVSEERISSIFRVEKSTSEESAWAGGCNPRHDEAGPQRDLDIKVTWRMPSSGMWRSVYLVWWLLTPVPRSRISLPWRWRQYIPPKRRFTQHLPGATSQNTALFIVTTVTTSNPTWINYFYYFFYY